MIPRRRFWTIGLSLIVLAILWLARSETSLQLLAILTILAFSLWELLFELKALVSSTWQPIEPEIPAGAVPADGVVEVAPIRGLEASPCSSITKYRRYVGLTRAESPPSVPSSRSPRLLGRVAIIPVFVGRDGVAWSDREIATSLEAIERAGVWIEREAIRLAAPVNLFVAETYFQVEVESDEVEVEFSFEGDDVGPMEGNAITKSVVMASRAAATLGFCDVADWMTRIDERIEANATAWLFLERRAGRSMAIPAEFSGLPGVGFAVCYAREASFPEPLRGKPMLDASTIAHELLHLFGASDKYGVKLGSFPKGSVTSREIMRLNHDSLYRMTIDSLTALEIGWPVDLESPTTKKIARRYPSQG